MPDAVTAERRISDLFVGKLGLDIPSRETDLFETGALDSMAFVELLALLEEEFGVAVSLDEIDIDSFRSIERIAAFVAGRNGRPPGAGTA
jgi:acyl carrier protein